MELFFAESRSAFRMVRAVTNVESSTHSAKFVDISLFCIKADLVHSRAREGETELWLSWATLLYPAFKHRSLATKHRSLVQSDPVSHLSHIKGELFYLCESLRLKEKKIFCEVFYVDFRCSSLGLILVNNCRFVKWGISVGWVLTHVLWKWNLLESKFCNLVYNYLFIYYLNYNYLDNNHAYSNQIRRTLS